MDSPFRSGWLSFGLGDYRACSATYQEYPCETLPRIDERLLQGHYEWLTRSESSGCEGLVDDEYSEEASEWNGDDELARLILAMDQVGRQLPADFVRFFQDRNLEYSIPSCTGCWWPLSAAPVPCRVTPGACTVQFLRDQQDCLFWYLYLTPDGGHQVICSRLCFDDPGFDEEIDVIKDNTWTCAPHFEHFVYRWWFENMLWYLLHKSGGAEFTREQQAYLDHCARNLSAGS